MGLFDKKKSDDFGSPVERIDLSNVSTSSASLAHGAVSGGASLSGRSVQMPIPATVSEPEPARYGIAQAIELMRALPQENVELVVQVVKRTLESTHIRIDTIIQDAARKQGEIEGRVSVLRQEIAELEREIATRRGEIATLDADYKETSMVKERLLLAERLTPGRAVQGTAAEETGRVEGRAQAAPAASKTSGAVVAGGSGSSASLPGMISPGAQGAIPTPIGVGPLGGTKR